jgi:hypothetical protein
MKVSILILAVILLLLLAGVVLPGSAPAQAQAGASSTTQAGLPSGGSYRLNGVAGEAVFVSTGEGYRLRWGSTVAPRALPDQGAGCCCTYLPCIQHR